MAKHNETGINGEQIAENFLLKKGYVILHRNWRFEKKEIDLVAETNGLLVFVEVKTRSRTDFGFPEEAVDYRKEEHMKIAAEAFMEANDSYKEIRFDVISVLKQGSDIKEVHHIEDAFF